MYVHRFAEQRQHLFHPDNADQLKEACADMEARLPALLKEAGFPGEHIPIIKNWELLVQDCVRFGHLGSRVQVNLNVVKDSPDAEFLASQHEYIRTKFEKEFQYFLHPFYQFTLGEQWWIGENVFLVSDANSYLMHCKYTVGVRFEEVRDYKPKKRGRPRNEDAHVTKSEQASRYKEWVENCRAYRQELQAKADTLKTAETQAKYEIKSIQRMCADQIEEVEKVVMSKRIELNVLKAQGAPKWIP